MTSKPLAALGLAMLLSTGALHAESVDLATITCGDMGNFDEESLTAVLFWADGYLGGAASDTTFDLERMSQTLDVVMVMCEEDSSLGLLDSIAAAEEEITK